MSADLELMRERYLELALEDLQGRDHSRLAARILASTVNESTGDAIFAPVAVLPARAGGWRAVRSWLQAACLVLALGVMAGLIVQRTSPEDNTLPANVPATPPKDDGKTDTRPDNVEEFLEPDSTEDHVRQYLRVNDHDRDGKISWDEARAATLRMEREVESARTVEQAKAAQALADYTVDVDWFLRADADDDLVLSRDELVRAIEHNSTEPGEKPRPPQVLTREDARRLQNFWVETAWAAFVAEYDIDKDGGLSAKELQAVFEGWWMNEDEDRPSTAEIWFRYADKDENGRLDRNEFIAFLDRAADDDPQHPAGVDELAEAWRWALRIEADRLHAPNRSLTLTDKSSWFVRQLDPKGQWQYCLVQARRVSAFHIEGRPACTDADKQLVPKPPSHAISSSHYGGSHMLLTPSTPVKLKLKTGEVDCLLIVEDKLEGPDGKPLIRRTWRLKDYPVLEVRREEDGKLVEEILELNLK